MNSQQRAAGMPQWLARWVLFFEWEIQNSLQQFSASLAPFSRVLDAGAGECQHKCHFSGHRYFAVDLAIGDANWNYGKLNAVADLAALPLAAATFDAAIHIVTLEHVPEPKLVLQEISRCLRPGAPILVVVPHEWEVHQHPHDYFRYTCFGMRYLLEQAGFTSIEVRPSGGYFRLLARRLLNSLPFFSWPWKALVFLIVSPVALMLPMLEPLDKNKDFTLGYICTARKL